MRPAIVSGILVSAAGLAGCGGEDLLTVRFASAPQRQASTELRRFLFAGEDAPPGCLALDPRGLGPGDAAARTGLTPAAADVVDPESPPDTLPEVAPGSYTVVLEAWGPPCQDIRSGAEEPVCVRVATGEPTVLRGYFCNDYTLGEGRVDAVAELTSFADIGATMTVPTAFPTEARRYDADAPLIVGDGQAGRDRFVVQLLSGTADELDDVEVRFSVARGAGSLADPQPVLTAPRPELQDQGLASALLRASRGASEGDGTIEVTAYAPGFEGSPIRFFARAVPNVTLTLERVDVPRDVASLATRYEASPVALDDLDGDGQLDVVTVTGGADHQLLVHYGGSDTVATSTAVARQARALTVARLEPGVPSVIVSAAAPFGERADTPDGRTFVTRDSVLEIFRGLEQRGGGAIAAPAVVDTIDAAPIDKTTIALAAADLDGDGVDEIAATRCSYLFLSGVGQSGFVRCYGRVIDRTDSEILLLRKAPGDAFTRSARIAGEAGQGGFREATFGDINDDGSLDLVFASNSEVHGVCGNRFQGSIGFGFDGATPFDTTITFASGYAVGVGHFDDDRLGDVLVTGSVRASSQDAGIKVVGGGACDRFDPGPPSIVAGPKTRASMLTARVADLNGDAYDDVLLLHREQRTLSVYLGGGGQDFGAGPELELPAGVLGALGVGVEQAGGARRVVAATTGARENAIFRVYVEPAR